MTSRQGWAEMYRAHTCFKGLVRTSELAKTREVGLVRLDSDVPPCRACRAWWRRCEQKTGIRVEIRSPDGTWRAS
jgi:hypothetical protein